MIDSIELDGRVIHVNLSERHHRVSGAPITASLKTAIDRVSDTNFNGQEVDEVAVTAMDEILASDVCLSFELFTMKRAPFHPGLAHMIVHETKDGTELFDALGGRGLSQFLEKHVHNSAIRHQTNKILAMLVCSCQGITSIWDFHEPALRILRAIRKDSRWDPEYFRGDPCFSCLKHVFLAFYRLTGDEEFRENSGNLRVTYGNSITWQAFLVEKRSLPSSIRPYYLQYIENAEGRQPKNGNMILHFSRWIESQFGDISIEDVLAKGKPAIAFSDWIEQKAGKPTANHQEILRLAMLFSDYLAENQTSSSEPHLLVTEKEYKKFRDRVSLNKPKGSTGKGKIKEFPEDYHDIYLEILLEGENGWPGRQSIFYAMVEVAPGVWENKYCPVLPTLLIGVAKLGARTAQVKRLDSGEGDTVRYNPHIEKWEDNRRSNAGYWIRRYGAQSPDARNRNYAHDFGSFTGFYLNTNKTGPAHPLPLNDKELHLLFFELADFQEKFNRVAEPTFAEGYVDGESNYPKKTTREFPEVFLLFRLPPSDRSTRDRSRPPSSTLCLKANAIVMEEVENRINQRNPDRSVKLVKRNEKTNQPEKAIFTLHGHRSAKATKALRAGVPFEVVSRDILGHSSLTMTSQYDRRGLEEFEHLLRPETIAVNASQKQVFVGQFHNWSEQRAIQNVATVYPNGLDIACSEDSFHALLDVGIGLCPKDGSGCDTGSPSGTLVEGGHHNCICCVYFVTGSPWATQLFTYDVLLTQRIERVEAELEHLNLQHSSAYEAVQNGTGDRNTFMMIRDTIKGRRNKLEVRLRMLRRSKVNVTHLIEVCKSDLQKSERASLIVRDMDGLRAALERPGFQQTAFLSLFSRIYTVLHDEDTEAKLKEYLTTIAFHNELRPCFTMSQFSDEEKRRSADYYSRVLALFEDQGLVERSLEGKAKLKTTKEGRSVLAVLKASFVDQELLEAVGHIRQKRLDS